MTILHKTFAFVFRVLNQVITLILPCLPKWMAKPFASPYVAGETIQDAILHAHLLNTRGYSVTLDILGEHVHSIDEAKDVTEAYCDLLNRIHIEKLDSTISVKPTHLGLELDKEIAENNFLTIIQKAKQLGLQVTIDMENSPYTEETLQIYQTCLEEHSGTGTVLQAYLFRSVEDVRSLDAPDFRLRICKGIYKESSGIAYHNSDDIRQNFIKMVKTILNGQGYAEIATHDLKIIDHLDEWITYNQVDKSRFEFQVLYGVPMGDRLECLKNKGYKVRVYVPFGKSWFDYSIRRLKENPNIIWYILGNIVKRLGKQ